MKSFGKKNTSNKSPREINSSIVAGDGGTHRHKKILSYLPMPKNKKIVGLVVLVSVVLAMGSFGLFQLYNARQTTTPTIPSVTTDDTKVKELVSKLQNTKDPKTQAELETQIADRLKFLGQWQDAKNYYDSSKKYYSSKSDKVTTQTIDNSIQFVDRQVDIANKQKSINFPSKTTEPSDKSIWATN